MAILKGKVAAALKEHELEDNAFKNLPDFAKYNTPVHNVQKIDTFKTPTSLDMKPSSPCKMIDRTNLQEICEQGFAKAARRLETQLLEDMKQAMQDQMREFTDELVHNMQHEGKLEDSIQKINEALLQLQHDFRKSTSVMDLREEIRNNEILRLQSQKDLVKFIEETVSNTTPTQTHDDLQAIRRSLQDIEQTCITEIRQELQKANLSNDIDESMRRSEDQLDKVLTMQEWLNTESTKKCNEMRDLHKESLSCIESVASLVPSIETFMNESAHTSHDSSEVDALASMMNDIRRDARTEKQVMMSELARIQQALNVDFARIVEDVHESKERLSVIAGSANPIGEATPSGGLSPGSRGRRQSTVAFCQRAQKRFQSSSSQTECAEHCENFAQTDEWLSPTPVSKKEKKQAWTKKTEDKAVKEETFHRTASVDNKANKAIFADAEAMKQKLRENLMKPQYNVADYYYERGIARSIATSSLFENLTLGVIVANTIWIAVDADHNQAAVLINAHPIFQFVENAFCLFFTFELYIRFLAFKVKRNCLRDCWFIFDGCLVFMMVLETWVMTVVALAMDSGNSIDFGNASILRMSRMVRMLRISRMARLLRMVPELVILMKGIVASSRSVTVFFALWLIIIYVFAIAFRQLTDDSHIGEQYFPSVPHAMNTLLLDCLLTVNPDVVNNVTDFHPLYWPLIMFFIMLTSVTIMYMLIGTLVELVGVIASSEKEAMTVTAIATRVRQAFENADRSVDLPIMKHEFRDLLLQPGIARVVHDAGVDATVLLDMGDVIFEDPENQLMGLAFEGFIEIVLNMRGNNAATVKDVKEQIKLTKKIVKDGVDELAKKLRDSFREVREEISNVRNDVRRMGEELGDEEDSDDDDGDFQNPAQIVPSSGLAPLPMQGRRSSGNRVPPTITESHSPPPLL